MAKTPAKNAKFAHTSRLVRAGVSRASRHQVRWRRRRIRGLSLGGARPRRVRSVSNRRRSTVGFEREVRCPGRDGGVRAGEVWPGDAMAHHDEAGIGDFVLLDQINIDSFMENLQVRWVPACLAGWSVGGGWRFVGAGGRRCVSTARPAAALLLCAASIADSSRPGQRDLCGFLHVLNFAKRCS